MPFFYYGYYMNNDSLYSYSILLLFAGLFLALFAQIKVKSNFMKYSKVQSTLTGEEAARRLLSLNGIYNVEIKTCNGNLTDHFDPRTNTIYLSENVFSKNTVAAVGIACHEAGHAVQYATSYAPLKIRNAIIPVTRIGSSLSIPLVFLGLLFSFYPLSLIGVAFFGLSTLFQLITLPVEFNASRRAMNSINEDLALSGGADTKGVKKILTAAALTYVAALVTSLAQFLRLLSLVNRRR
jgi:Zn-dependent membrane protease YugP